MIAVDTNILVYAHRPDSTWHKAAAARIKALCEGPTSWLVPWPCIHEFLSVVTNPRVFANPTPPQRALQQVEYWAATPSLVIATESARHLQTLAGVVLDGTAFGGRIHDARVVAICLDHGVGELWSADRDFSRFPALKTHNPLVGTP